MTPSNCFYIWLDLLKLHDNSVKNFAVTAFLQFLKLFRKVTTADKIFGKSKESKQNWKKPKIFFCLIFEYYFQNFISAWEVGTGPRPRPVLRFVNIS